MFQTKPEWRAHYKSISLAQESNARTLANRNLCSRLEHVLAHADGYWAGFQSLGYEPDLSLAIAKLKNIKWVFPRVFGDDLHFFRVEASEKMIASSWGVREPDPKTAMKIANEDIRGFLVPGLAFDHGGVRLGRGRGYYDRLFSQVSHLNPIKIGIAFEYQTANEKLPLDSHDIRMDRVLTDLSFFDQSGRTLKLDDSSLVERKSS